MSIMFYKTRAAILRSPRSCRSPRTGASITVRRRGADRPSQQRCRREPTGERSQNASNHLPFGFDRWWSLVIVTATVTETDDTILNHTARPQESTVIASEVIGDGPG